MLTPNSWVAWRNHLVDGVPYWRVVRGQMTDAKYAAALNTYQTSEPPGDMQYWNESNVRLKIQEDVQFTTDMLFGKDDVHQYIDALLYQVLVGFVIVNAEVTNVTVESAIPVTVDIVTGLGATTATGEQTGTGKIQ